MRFLKPRWLVVFRSVRGTPIHERGFLTRWGAARELGRYPAPYPVPGFGPMWTREILRIRAREEKP